MTTIEIGRLRSEARKMTLEQIRAAYLRAVGLYATAKTFEDEQRGHHMAGEYAEIFQARRSEAR